VHQLWKLFRKDALETGSVWTEPFANEYFEDETSSSKRDIGNGALVATVNP